VAGAHGARGGVRVALLVAVVLGVVAAPGLGRSRVVVVPAVQSTNGTITSSDSLPLAYWRLHRAGLRVSVPTAVSVSSQSNCWPFVVSQRPRAGSHVRPGAVVTLSAGVAPCPLASPAVPSPLPSATVPDFAGATVAAGAAWAGRHKLYWQSDLPPLVAGRARQLLGNFHVVRQQPQPGAVLALGTTGPGAGFTATPLVLHAVQ
jgi:beta-lactam-binding protein with PASTA domain